MLNFQVGLNEEEVQELHKNHKKKHLEIPLDGFCN